MHEYQSLLVLQGRSIAINLGNFLFQIIEKDDVRVQIRSNLFFDISDDFYVLKLCLIEFVERTIENSLKVSKNHQWWFLAIFDHF